MSEANDAEHLNDKQKTVATAQERRVWFVFHLFYYLIRASRCFFLPFIKPSL